MTRPPSRLLAPSARLMQRRLLVGLLLVLGLAALVPAVSASVRPSAIAPAAAQAPVPAPIAPGNENWASGFRLSGMDGTVYAVAAGGNGSVYVGGTFTTAGGVTVNRIARWDGSSWSALGGGMNLFVYALAVGSDGSLYASGNFTTADGVTANRVARW
ncbi:MAG TPA: hypothetical protein VD886_25280, partial [Herpetosiphonaceae bacterium]|nr:hypothetical protein [Herpetosiphonaceae bacterium]